MNLILMKIKKFFNNNMKLIKERYEGFKKFDVKFYNLDAAPIAV